MTHGSRYKTVSELDYDEVKTTIVQLEQRIADRFPSSNLRVVCQKFIGIAEKTKSNIAWISRPNWWLRSLTYGTVGLAVFGIVSALFLVEFKVEDTTLSTLAALFESVINDLVLLGAAIYFLTTIEKRVKRSRALEALHELRVIAHVVDMHQLTKDPNRFTEDQEDTEHSPTRTYTKKELERYLDYCSEIASLIGKVAALYSQYLPDDVVVSAVNDIEVLGNGISTKVWEKLSILNDLGR